MKKLSAKKFDEVFERGENVLEHLDISKARRVNEKTRRVNIDFPEWVIARLDQEANHIGMAELPKDQLRGAGDENYSFVSKTKLPKIINNDGKSKLRSVCLSEICLLV